MADELKPTKPAVSESADAAVAFLDAYFAAPDDADLAFRIGATADAPTDAMVLVWINGEMVLAASPEASRLMADIAEGAMHKFPAMREAKALPNLILALRASADKAEEARRAA